MDSDAATPVEPELTGSCGDNVTWKLEDGVLIFSGTGATYDYHLMDRPWDDYCMDITKVVIGNGITVIGGNLCSNFDNLQEITIPASVSKIEMSAFENCTSLKKITFLGDAPDVIA